MKKILVSAMTVVLLFSAVSDALADSFPANVGYRKALTGPGYVLVINTTIKQDLPATLQVTSTALGTVRSYTVNLTWRHAAEFGYREGITVYPGDHIELANNYYETLAVDLPR